MKTAIRFIICPLVLLTLSDALNSYPIDGYALTGIRRLKRLSLIVEGKARGTMPLPGARKSIAEIGLNLLGARGDSLDVLPVADVNLQKQIDALFPNRHESYGLAVLDITPGRAIRFAGRHPDRQLSPGSVGKLVIASGFFAELKKIYPESPEKRFDLMRNRMVVADKWIHTDNHEVPVYDPETGSYALRVIREGDEFSLYEWLDHMLSASNNSAASIVWKEVMLMHAFGKNYPPTPLQEQEFFSNTKRDSLRAIAMTVNEPLRAAGIDAREWQLGSFFTGAGKRLVPGGGGSFATPAGYLKFLVALERGKIVDEWASLEIKRLMYMTARRIRYASAPALNNAAVYFKSGSLYRCKPEPEFKCGKYMGNVENMMNSVAIVEQPGGHVYLVGLMSNILRKNSAVEHQSLAIFIDRIITR